MLSSSASLLQLRARAELERRRRGNDGPRFALPAVILGEAQPGRPLVDVTESGRLVLRAHAGQQAAHSSRSRFIVVLAGKQGGKTSYGPMWLSQEIEATADPAGGNDYIAGTATYDLFKLKMLPALRDWFEQRLGWGRYWSGDRIIELRDPATGRFWAERGDDPMWGRIILRSADSALGWASATARGGWLDEAGAKTYGQDVLDEAQARVAIARGRLLLTTTIYDLGALKSAFYDPWIKANRQHPEIAIIQFDSTKNPEFSPEEFERLRTTMPGWKFNQRYRGIYERPAGLIYDCFDLLRNTCPRFAIPDAWQRHGGLDFGGVNTAAVFLAEEPGTSRLFAYREYHAGDRTAEEHAQAMLRGEPAVPFFVGGAKSEGQWRKEFRKGGIPVGAPQISEVEIQIGKVYAALKTGGLVIFDDLAGLLGDLQDYQREVDGDGEPTEKILNESKYHYHAALRYIISRIR